jgi:hypothetical protein
MNEIVLKFEFAGPCEVDVAAVVAAWNDQWFISQWQNDYRLIGPELKVSITKQQAKEIIVELDLMPTQSLFRSGKTWRKE